MIAMTIDITARLLMELDTFFTATTQGASTWAYPTDPQLTPATRRHLETIQIHTLQSQTIDRGRELGGTEPTRTETATLVEVRGIESKNLNSDAKEIPTGTISNDADPKRGETRVEVFEARQVLERPRKDGRPWWR